MPLIKDAPHRKKTKSFEKKEYRPWDLFGDKEVTINAQLPPQAHEQPFVKTPFRPNHADVFEQIEPVQENQRAIDTSSAGHQSTTDVQAPSSTSDEIANTEEISSSRINHPIKSINNPLGNDQGTIREPLGDIIREPLGNDQGTIRGQLSQSNHAKKIHQGTIRGRIREQHQGTIREPLGDGLGNKKYCISQLTGLQKSILFYIVDSCIFKGQLTSEYLTNETLRHIAKTTSESVKTTLKRLVAKGFIRREGGKPGNGGGASFSITSLLRDEVLNEKRYSSIREPLGDGLGNSIREPLGNHQGTDQGTNSPSSSSSFKDLKTTTTNALPDEWDFDIAVYAKFGFTESQLKQLISLNIISPSDVEQSLIEFSYDIENNSLPAIKTSKINFLMGLLRKGQSYVSEGFQNEQETMISEMAKRAEGKRKNRLESEFAVWESGLTDDDRKQIEKMMPNSLIILYRTYGIEKNEVKNWMFNYFLNKKS